MDIIPVIAGTALVLGLGLLVVYYFQQRNFGVLKNKIIYSDISNLPAKTLFAKSIALCGKPDHLIKQGSMIYPVEVKSGRTPKFPYQNHVMQLMAYCLLVEENYGVRPLGGFLKYPDREFKIAYTDDAKQSIKNLVGEMLLLKFSNKEPQCSHYQHNHN